MFGKIKYAFIAGILLLVAVFLGYKAASFGRAFYAAKQVALRIGNRQEQIDYDLLCALNFLKYQIKKNGYHLAGESYGGNLYPRELDRAGVNVFVRGFEPFFDVRMNEKGGNVFYIHRGPNIYKEELRNFDAYLSSLQKLKDSFENVYFLAGGYVPHQRLNPTPEYDVLYIYEYIDPAYSDFLQEHTNAKVYSGMEFAALSDEEREDALKKARLVVYGMAVNEQNAEGYVPYAVYDIMSYGRPILTNTHTSLQSFFTDNVFMFSSSEEMMTQTVEALRLSDEERETRGRNARKQLKENISHKTPVGEMLKKISQKSYGV